MVIFILKRDFIMTDIQLIILLAVVTAVVYPSAKAGAEEIVLDLARLLAWVITCVKRFLGW